MACGGCGSGRQYSHRSVRRTNGSRRQSSQSNAIVFSERAHGGYILQIAPEDTVSISKIDEDGNKEHAE